MSQVKKLTRFGSDTRKIAALLQSKAPKGEMLAYISPQEAALLKSRGGSGKPHADTGIPSFQMEEDAAFPEAYMAEAYSPQFSLSPPPQPTSEFAPDFRQEFFGGAPSSEMYGFGYGGTDFGQRVAPQTISPQPVFFPEQMFGAAQPAPEPTVGPLPQVAPLAGAGAGAFDTTRPTPAVSAEPAAKGGMSEALKSLGLTGGNLALLGVGGLQALLGSRQARQAQQQGQVARREQETIAAPYRVQGQQLQAQAARGELTPQSQQSLQAARAQLAQQVQGRGGVGVNQAVAQLENTRQQLLQAQADYGLKLSGIGDQIALGAIRSGMQADQNVNQLISSYMNNIMRMVGQVYAPTQPTTTQRPT